ncbi:hypothetical protein AZI87_05480 [Bdellovibrio bacteriovorus]|uniref:Uncharacterized protein n=1 Tax=Bdellovibrio bacteriovorus TaxID=959 RepID=A0A161PUR0_BDEBC|nr:hypothetical protein [Bdellovibrio bacteriovorus]KYG68686.1 hypothetical protein AZI87_05480 [Bdellovibrio bacteriovorus]
MDLDPMLRFLKQQGSALGSLISHLTQTQQKELLADLNYLNMQEIKKFCRLHGLPLNIHAEYKKGEVQKTNELDRKGVVLDRVRQYLKTGKVPGPSIIGHKMIAEKFPAKIDGKTPLLFGLYKNRDAKVLKALQEITNGKFRFGALAQELSREIWIQGKKTNFAAFAKLWLQEMENPEKVHPEWAFLTDLSAGTAGKDWKAVRIKKAKSVMAELSKIPAPTKY